MSLQTDLLFQVTAILADAAGSPLDLASRESKISVRGQLSIPDGSAANKANKAWSDRRTTSGNDDIDLNGVLVDAFGTTLNFTRVGLLYVRADSANVGNVLVGPAPANGFVTPWNAAADRSIVRPGGYLILSAFDATGFAVAAGTGDILRIAPSSGSVTYDIIIIGS
jgi:hypothetical protein